MEGIAHVAAVGAPGGLSMVIWRVTTTKDRVTAIEETYKCPLSQKGTPRRVLCEWPAFFEDLTALFSADADAGDAADVGTDADADADADPYFCKTGSVYVTVMSPDEGVRHFLPIAALSRVVPNVVAYVADIVPDVAVSGVTMPTEGSAWATEWRRAFSDAMPPQSMTRTATLPSPAAELDLHVPIDARRFAFDGTRLVDDTRLRLARWTHVGALVFVEVAGSLLCHETAEGLSPALMGGGRGWQLRLVERKDSGNVGRDEALMLEITGPGAKPQYSSIVLSGVRMLSTGQKGVPWKLLETRPKEAADFFSTSRT